jgi:hypothetical protein
MALGICSNLVSMGLSGFKLLPFFLIKKKNSCWWFLRAIHLLPPVFLSSVVCFILHILHVEAFISQLRWGKVNEIKWAGVFSSNTPCSPPIYPEGLF